MADLHYADVRLEVKADTSGRTLTGIASTPSLDRHGEIFDVTGASFTNPIPLLFHHNQERPVGTATLTRVGAALHFVAQLADTEEPGPLRDQLAHVRQLVTTGLLRGASIGFRVLDDGIEIVKGGIRKIIKSEICELSLVTVPANRDATILTIKTATPRSRTMTIQEQITGLETRRTAALSRQADIMTLAAEQNRTLDESETADYDNLAEETKSMTSHLGRLRELERHQAAAAVPIAATLTGPAPLPVITVRPNVRPGTAFFRYCQAKAYGRGDSMRELEFAKQWQDSTPEVSLLLKAAVAAGTTTDATWAGPLAPIKPITDEFLAMLRPATILGKVPSFFKVPFNISIPSQTGGGTYAWVGQGAPKPVGKLAFATITLGITKCAGIIAITEELARNSSPDAEDVIRRDMVAGIAQFLDTEFIDPTKAAVAGVSPGSVTNGVTPITTAGTTPANARTDVQAMANAMTALNISTAGAVLVLSETNALAFTNALNPLGQPLFPGMQQDGGTIMGYKAITSQVAGTTVALIQPNQVLYADDGGVTIDVSREATVQMDSAPAAVPDATTVYTSFWQMNYVGLRAERFINWKKARTGVVQYTVATYAA